MFLFRDFTLDGNKDICVSLHSIYGVGRNKAIVISSKVGLAYPFRLNRINAFTYSMIFSLLKRLVISDVRIKRIVSSNISSLISMGTYKGMRHKLCLPVRGQRTRTNANTQRSKRVRKGIVMKKKK